MVCDLWQVDFNLFCVLVFQFSLLVLVIISMIESNEKCNCEGSFWTSEFVFLKSEVKFVDKISLYV